MIELKSGRENIVELKNVVKEYSLDSQKLRVLDDVSCSVKRGEFVCVMGPSGSGKSTLLHILGCLDKPTQGQVYVDGVLVSALNDDALAEIRRDKIGFVFQAFNLAPTLNTFQNVELPLIISGWDAQDRKRIATRMLKLVGLENKAQSMPSQLSGGEKQRVAVARALTNNPTILLADEPTGNLDSKSGKEVMDLFSKLWRGQGMTVILITHEPQVAAYGNRLIQLRDGHIEKDEPQRQRKVDVKKLKEKVMK